MRYRKSVKELKERLPRSSRIAWAAESPTPRTAARPNRIACRVAAKERCDSLMSGGSTGTPAIAHSPITRTISSVEPIDEVRQAAMK
jgi:hypothetical protein